MKIKLIESERVKNLMKSKLEESNATIKNSRYDSQLLFLTNENERLQKLIISRCRD